MEREAHAALTARWRLLLAGSRRLSWSRKLSLTHGLAGVFVLGLALASTVGLLACGGGAASAPTVGSSPTSRPTSAGAATASSAAF